MPADTLTEMILGFSVILGGLLLYALSLFLRIRRAQNRKKNIKDHLPKAK